MPRLLVFTVSEKVIVDAMNSASIINLIDGIEAANMPPNPATIMPPLPRNAVAPISWTIFAKWKPLEGDVGREYKQKVVVLSPDGNQFQSIEAPFKFEPNKNHQVTMAVSGFPVGQVGDVSIKMSLERDNRRIGDEHTWIVTVKHRVSSGLIS